MPAAAPPHVKRRRRDRRQRLLALGYEDYNAYLRSPHWEGLKARYRASDLPQKCICGDEQVQLHHTTYERIGAEPLTDLIPLCATCHAMVHALEARGDVGLDLSGFTDQERAALNRAELRRIAARRRADEAAAAEVAGAALDALPLDERIRLMRRVARGQHRSIRSELRVVARALQAGSMEKVLRHLARIEASLGQRAA